MQSNKHRCLINVGNVDALRLEVDLIDVTTKWQLDLKKQLMAVFEITSHDRERAILDDPYVFN